MSTVALAGSPNNPRFAVIDFSNPNSSPSAVSPSFQGACQVKQDGASAYVGNQLGGQVQLFDISNPTAPVAHGTAPTILAGIGAIAVRGTRAAAGEATNTFKARICLIDFSSPDAPLILGYAPTPLVSVATSPTDTLAAISSLAFIGPNLVAASGPANFIIAIADFTNPANPTVTTFNPHAGPPCLDADENVQRIVTGDTNASWVRLYDTSWNLLATANSTLNSVDYISLSGLRALAGSNNTFQVALIDFRGMPPQVITFDPQMGGGSCTSIKGTLGSCGAVLGSNVKLFDMAAKPPTPLGNATTTLGAINSVDMGIVASTYTSDNFVIYTANNGNPNTEYYAPPPGQQKTYTVSMSNVIPAGTTITAAWYTLLDNIGNSMTCFAHIAVAPSPPNAIALTVGGNTTQPCRMRLRVYVQAS